ncbi:MAG: mannose-1-phosphate guanylyltransferase [Bacteroidetes bacterium]|nr:mannose-1-phosphate guanylyltransferase [Bacteroidota bacterium]
MNKNNFGVIMAGGVGSRFWPLSRKQFPKQFIDIIGDGTTLFQKAYNRLAKHCLPENIYIVTNEGYRGIVKEQVPTLTDDQILGEPSARNTAPCIAYASFKIHAKRKDAVIAVVPSDHLILDEKEFEATMNAAFETAGNSNNLITIGIKPSRPDTGYGYIQMDEDSRSGDAFKVKTFTEKPNLELAKQFYESGEFLWNSGMFVWKASVIKEQLHKHTPEIYSLFVKGENLFYTKDETPFINKMYDLCPMISIDYGVMEKADNVFVLPGNFSWSDIGTWNALYEFAEKDANNNVIRGEMVLSRNTTNCIVNVSDKKLVALKGLNNLIIVEADGILLIADKDKEQEIRQVVNDVKLKHGDKFA